MAGKLSSFQKGYTKKKKKLSMHQIQGGAMNAAHVHVCALTCYIKAKRTVPLSINTFSVTAQLGHKLIKWSIHKITSQWSNGGFMWIT